LIQPAECAAISQVLGTVAPEMRAVEVMRVVERQCVGKKLLSSSDLLKLLPAPSLSLERLRL
jgi:hypothetical protein